ncbi:hypothetical protein ACWEOE_10955 [Amycolatopsis sp. NPDC004368]
MNLTKPLTAGAALLTAVAVFFLGVSAGDARTELTATQPVVAAGKQLAQQTEQCVGGSMSTDSAQCRQAAQKAAEVKAAPEPAAATVVTAPRRSDAEVMALIEQTIRENPSLLPKGEDGKPYVLTDADKAELVALVRGEIPDPKDGKDAVVDYDKIVTAVLALIPTPKDGITPPCMSTDAKCQGAAGKDGRGVSHTEFRWTSPDTCAVVLTYTDGSAEQFNASPELCDPAARPS